MRGPTRSLINGGDRLHLHHGPIDLIIGCDPDCESMRSRVFAAATGCFDGLLERLVEELGRLRSPLLPTAEMPTGPVARRMTRAALPFCDGRFLTPMIAVAGSVADTVLDTMRSAGPLRRAYVNNGGDIALHIEPGAAFRIAVADHSGAALGRLDLRAEDGVGGVATSGRHGRSQSLGIADSVTVLAADAATADVAATLIANSVDLPGHPAIFRRRANELDLDSDLGGRLVVTSVASLTPEETRSALERGASEARRMLAAGQIIGAALFLHGQSTVVGAMADLAIKDCKDLTHA